MGNDKISELDKNLYNHSLPPVVHRYLETNRSEMVIFYRGHMDKK